MFSVFIVLKPYDDIKIITLEPQDWHLYKKLRIEAVNESPQAFGTTYEDELNTSEQDWKRRLGLNMLFACKKGKIIGMVGAVIPSSKRLNHTAKLISMYVVPEERGHHVASALLAKLLDHLKDFPELKKITLQVTLEQIAAIKLYKKFGFHVSGVLENEYKVGNNFYDQLIMTKDISQNHATSTEASIQHNDHNLGESCHVQVNDQ